MAAMKTYAHRLHPMIRDSFPEALGGLTAGGVATLIGWFSQTAGLTLTLLLLSYIILGGATVYVFRAKRQPLLVGSSPLPRFGRRVRFLMVSMLIGATSCACGSSGAAVCGAGGVMTWERGRGKGREGAEGVDVDYALATATDSTLLHVEAEIARGRPPWSPLPVRAGGASACPERAEADVEATCP